MPKKPDQRTDAQKQSDHAARIKTERTVMRMTGLSRTQLRTLRGLELFAQRTAEARPPATATVSEGPKIQRQDTTLGGGAFGVTTRRDDIVNQRTVTGEVVTAAMGLKAEGSDEFIAHEVTLQILSSTPLEP